MRKLLIFLMVFVLLIGIISASALSTLWKQGVSAANPQAAKVIGMADQIMEVQSLAQCVTGIGASACMQSIVEQKAMGQVYGEAIKAAGPEVQKIISTYQQLDLYRQAGLELINPKVDENGHIIEIEPTEISEKAQKIGKLLGEKFKEDYIITGNVELSKENGILTISPTGKNPYLKIDGKEYNILSEDDAGLPSYVKIDKNGKIEELRVTVGEKGGTFDCGTGEFYAPYNSRVICNKESGKPPNVKLAENSEINLLLDSENYPNLEGEVYYEGINFKIGNNEIKGLSESLGKVSVSNGKIIRVWEDTDAIVDGIQHKTFKNDLNLYYDEGFDASSHSGENYFNYGKDKIWLGGDGFKSSLKAGNNVFPEYIQNKYQGSYVERKGRLEFILEGGNLEVTKISPDKSPLALDIKSLGKSKISNGNWILESDGNNVYAKLDDWYDFPLSSDIKFNYHDTMGKSKIYDLDVNSKYKSLLSKQENDEFAIKINNLENLKQKKDEEINRLINDPSVKQISNEIDKINERISKNNDEYDYLDGQLVRAERAGTQEQVVEIKEKIKKNNEEYDKLKVERNDLTKKNQDYKRLYTLKEDVRELSSEIYDLDEIKKIGKTRTGVWGQILTSENGDSQVSYSEYIEGFPVIKNTEVKNYYGEVYRPDLGYTVSGRRLPEPKTVIKDVDILDLIVDSKYQTCADTQVELHSIWELEELEKGNIDSIEFQIANGKKLKYSPDGTYTIWNANTKKVESKSYKGSISGGFKDWISNVQVYSNTGSLRSSLIPITEINDLKPGDLLTLHPDPKTGYGHTKAIREIIRIPPDRDGKIYYKLFAGSDPAIDPEIFRDLVSQEEMIDEINKGAVILTWK